MHILLIYATVEGQTRKIAHHVQKYLSANGHQVTEIDATHPPDSLSVDGVAGVICTGPVHVGSFPAPLRRFVQRNQRDLMARPGAFLSVSLTAAGHDPNEMVELNEIVSAFSEETGWWPVTVHHVAGALKYTEYDYFRRWMLRRIADKKDAPTNTANDYEFTDWGELDLFVDGFLTDIPDLAGKV